MPILHCLELSSLTSTLNLEQSISFFILNFSNLYLKGFYKLIINEKVKKTSNKELTLLPQNKPTPGTSDSLTAEGSLDYRKQEWQIKPGKMSSSYLLQNILSYALKGPAGLRMAFLPHQ